MRPGSGAAGGPRFVVLNPGGHDADRHFPNRAGSPHDPGHPPVNFHAYAACMCGSFLRDVTPVAEGARALLLLRPRHLRRCARALEHLRQRGVRVWISWKETGSTQLARALGDASAWRDFEELAIAADGAISPVEDALPLYEAAGCRSAVFLPTPYPVEEAEWNFGRPLAERVGIWIGTRDFSEPFRNHLLAITSALTLEHPVTVMNTGGAAGRSMLRGIGEAIRIVEGPLPYAEYLGLMASHRIVFQLDRGGVPGQVAGDALLCRTPCVGGDGTIDRMAFPMLCSRGRTVGEILAAARPLLEDDAAWHSAVAALGDDARTVSFGTVAARLTALVG